MNDPEVTDLEFDILTLVSRLQQMDEEMTEEPHWLWRDRIIGCDVPRMLRHIRPSVIRWARDEMQSIR